MLAKISKAPAVIAAVKPENSKGKTLMQIKEMDEKDKVTQSNAAGAEESASAAEEMSAQAQQMKAMVAELLTLAGGGTDDSKHKREPRAKALDAGSRMELPASSSKVEARPAHQASQTSPEQIIPLDDDFEDF